MHINPIDLDGEQNYKLLTGIIVPRPIAWVTTIGSAGQTNAAPFSAFTFVSNKPPMVAISIGKRLSELKDTARNIAAHGEFVVNIANSGLLSPLHHSAVEHPEHVSETDFLDVPTTPSTLVRTPRIANVPVSMECRLHQILEFGIAKSQLVVGEVVMFHFQDGLCVDGKVNTRALDPVCRLGGPNYATLGEVIHMPAVKFARHT